MRATIALAALAVVAVAGCGAPAVTTGHTAESGEWVTEPVTGPVLDSIPVVLDGQVMLSASGPAKPRKGTGPALACVFTQAVNVDEDGGSTLTVGPGDFTAITPAGTNVPSVLFDGHEPFLSTELTAPGDGTKGYVCFDMEPSLVTAIEYGDGLVRWDLAPAMS